MKNFFDRLKALIQEHASGKHTIFAKKAGIPVSTFQSYLSDRLPHPEHLLRICETYRVNLDWLMTGQGERYRNEGQIRQAPPDYGVHRIDTVLLGKIIQAVEEGLQRRQATLTPEKKAELVALLYDIYSESGKALDSATVDRYLHLMM